MKLCILGNSHVGSLIRAWNNDLREVFPDVEITFFACPSGRLKYLTLSGKSLVTEHDVLSASIAYTSGGQSSIDLLKYDCFLVYGVGAKPYISNGNYYSKAGIDYSITDTCQGALSFRVASLIRRGIDKKIYIGHNPLVEMVKGDKTVSEQEESALGYYIEGIALLNRKFYSLMNAEILAQPTETISESGRNTRSIYSIGSKRLDFHHSHEGVVRLHPSDDVGHMNDEFGRIWLNSFLNKLSLQKV